MDYSIQTIIQRLSEPQNLNDPVEVNILSSYLNGFISESEEDEWKLQLLASHKLAELNTELSAAKADVQWRISKEYEDWKRAERTTRKLKRYRSDLKTRYEVLQIKRY